jgi:hypothetical protein
MKAGNLSVEGGDDLVCVHRANIAKLSMVTNSRWCTNQQTSLHFRYAIQFN